MPRSTHSNPGHRILVYGVTGSGKSTAAQLIAARTLLPLTLADELTWAPDWVPVAEDEQRRLFARAAFIQKALTDMPALGTEYDYIRGSALLRVSGEVKPSVATKYNAAFGGTLFQ